MAVKPIPEGARTVNPYLIVHDILRTVEFYKSAFGAQLQTLANGPDGKPMHASLIVGDSLVMVGQEMQHYPAFPAMLFLYFTDAEAKFRQALQAGGSQVQEFKDQAWGDRAGALKDADGNIYWVAVHIEDLTPEEIQQRMAGMKQEHGHNA